MRIRELTRFEVVRLGEARLARLRIVQAEHGGALNPEGRRLVVRSIFDGYTTLLDAGAVDSARRLVAP